MSKVNRNYEKVNVGFDIGIASVGWSVVHNETGKILEAGVSIFPSGTASKNVDRRGFRQSRRLLRRRRNRLDDLKMLLEEKGFPFIGTNAVENPYTIRVKGLTQRLSREELAVALYHLMKRRGISYDLRDSEEESSKGTNYQESIEINQQLLKSQTPAEIQLARLLQYGKIRGQVKDFESDDARILLNIFPNAAYKDEIKRILVKQKEFYPEIDDVFIDKAASMLSRKREYFVGPGSKKSRTDYGIYRTDGTILNNLFEILIGKDKIFPDEFRASGNSYSAQLFNLLNDLNNLTIDSNEESKLTTEQKAQIIDELTTNASNIDMMKLVAKVANTDLNGITRFRTDREGKPEIHHLAVYRKIRKKFLETGIDINGWPPSFFDDFGPVVTLNTENGEIRKWLQNEGIKDYDFLTDELIDLIIINKASFSMTSNSKWHNFSLKTLHLLIPELMNTSDEQMTILTKMGLLHKNKKNYEGIANIDVESLAENIFNPIVSKSVRQSMNIFNKLVAKYGNIAYVVIEMPRDDIEDESDEKKQYQKFQLENEKEKSASLKSFQELAGVSDVQFESKMRKRKKLRQKIRLWYQQEGDCPYSGKKISAVDLFHQDDLFEIDHIIPISVSFDDGQNNKVLCYSNMNQAKGQQTPYGFMSSGNGQGFQKLQAQLKSNKRMSEVKKKNLLYTENIHDIEVRKRFVARNLVDTRYASRVVLNELQQFFRSKQSETKVTVIRGKMTSKLRERWRLNKSRDSHHHHAVDATIIAVSPMLKIWERNTVIIPAKVDENQVEVIVNELISDDEYEELMYKPPYTRFLEQIPVLNEKIKFNHQVDKKMNRKVSDATIYATRRAMVGKDKSEQEYVIGKIKDIYNFEQYKKFRAVYDKDETKFLMQRLDPRSFDKLQQVLKDYPSKTEQVQPNGKVRQVDISPFELYRREHGFITKYAKKNNGPIIKSLKFYDSKVGNHIDITPEEAKGKRVVLQSINPWRTDVYYNNEEQTYEIMGLKYSDLCYRKGKYGITIEKYREIMKKEGVVATSEFLFSLYRRDRVKVSDGEESLELLFGSRTNPAIRGYVELKPINKSRFDGKEIVGFYGAMTPNGQFVKRFLPKGYSVLKVNTSELGDPFYIKKEGNSPKNILDQ